MTGSNKRSDRSVWKRYLIAPNILKMPKQFYFDKFENRRPYKAIADNRYRTLLFQFSGIITIFFGFAYLNWRWKYSLNPEAMWFSVPLVVAESLSFFSTILVVINFWSNKDAERTPPVRFLSEIEDIQ